MNSDTESADAVSVRLNTMDRRSLHPQRWNVRVRSTAAAVLAVTVCLLLASGALLFVLYRALEHSARVAADSRAHQIIEQLHTQPPQELDASLLATDGQIGAIQILDTQGNVLATSVGIPSSPVFASPLPPGESAYLGNLHFGHDRDYWVAAIGTTSPNGPVTVVTGATANWSKVSWPPSRRCSRSGPRSSSGSPPPPPTDSSALPFAPWRGSAPTWRQSPPLNSTNGSPCPRRETKSAI